MTERLKKYSKRWFFSSMVIALLALLATGILGMMQTLVWFVPFQIGLGAIGMMTTVFLAVIEEQTNPEAKETV